MSYSPQAAAFDAAMVPARNAGLSWLEARRQSERERFHTLGIPNRRMEQWRWTDLKPLNDLEFQAAENSDSAPADFGVARFEIIDGVAGVAQSFGAVRVMPLAVALAQAPALLEKHFGFPVESAAGLGALNVALSVDGALVHVPADTNAQQLVHLDFSNQGKRASCHSRSLIVVESNASLTLVETHTGAADCQYFAHPGFDIVLGEGAKLTHIRLEQEGASAIHIADARISVGANAHYESVALSTGARLARNDIGLRFTGSGASARLCSTYLALDHRHVDTTSLIDHLVPDCQSEQVVKGVVADHGRGVFQGKIIVRPGAQKTNARQLTKALVLSEQAEIDHKPELEIYADDVSCTHGATAGDLDEQALFYLESRGIPRAAARLMLVRAFLTDVLDQISDERVRDYLELALEKELSRLGGMPS